MLQILFMKYSKSACICKLEKDASLRNNLPVYREVILCMPFEKKIAVALASARFRFVQLIVSNINCTNFDTVKHSTAVYRKPS